MAEQRWTGIQQFNDNTRVTEYHNMIPMGDVCVDRLGCDLIPNVGFGDYASLGEFVDGKNNIYLIKNSDDGSFWIYKYSIAIGLIVSQKQVSGLPPVQRVSMVESSIAPQNIYLLCVTSTADYLFTWKTDDDSNTAPQMIEFPFGASRVYDSDNNVWLRYENQMAKTPRITNISWFDNRLIASDVANNIVWLSSTNFQTRLDNQLIFDNATPDEREEYRKDSAFMVTLRWTDNNGDNIFTDEAFPNWYGSTNNSDSLRAAYGFRGQIYMFFSRSIERWFRTGIEDAPIQFDTNGAIGVGGISPLIANDRMYFIGNDQLGNQFAGMFTENGSFVRISNSEIEQRFGGEMTDIALLLQRQDTFCVYRSSSSNRITKGYAVSQSGYWWEYNENTDQETPIRSLYGNIAISNKGNLCRFTEDHRLDLNGKPIPRYIRETTPIFPRNRQVASKLVVTCDTGFFRDPAEKENDDMHNSIWAMLSINKGLTFGRRFFRRLGRIGQNDKIMVFRNLGSGTQFTYEVGTAVNTKWQVYDISLDII